MTREDTSEPLNLRMGYWTSDPNNGYGLPAAPLPPELKDAGPYWYEDRARVWFDHRHKGWRAASLHGKPSLRYSSRDHSKPGSYCITAIGYDPMDAVDQLADMLCCSTEKSHYGPRQIMRDTWDKRAPMETDSHRGYGPTFQVNPYGYSLAAEYECWVAEVPEGYFAYLERHGCLYGGFDDWNPNRAVAKMIQEMTDKVGRLVRVPGTPAFVPPEAAAVMGIDPMIKED